MPRRGLYVALDVDIFENPKILQAGSMATLLYIKGLALCKRAGVDGHIHTTQLTTFRMRDVQKHATTLTQHNLWRAVDDGYEIVGWLDRNMSAAQIEQMKQDRRDAANKRWHGNDQLDHETDVGDDMQDASVTDAGCIATSMRSEKHGDAKSESSSSQDKSESSSSVSTNGTSAADALISAAFEIVTTKRIQDRKGDPIGNPSAYRTTVLDDVREQHLDRARQIAELRPDFVATDLAWYLDHPDQEPRPLQSMGATP